MNGERLVIRDGRVIDPANGIDAILPVYVADGRIAAVGVKPDGFYPDREIPAPGRIVCPGFVDLCARLREPGLEHKATIAGETLAAAASGVTTVCCPPDTDPVIDTPAVVRLIQERAERAGAARVLAIGALTRGLNGKDLSEMRALKDAGCLAVSNAEAPVANALVLRRALEYAASHDLLVIIRPEDPWLRNQGCVHEGAVGSRLGLPGIPSSAETVAVAQALALIEQTGVRAHFAQLSCARAVEMIASAQQTGVAVTADVAIHQAHLTEAAVDGFDALCHVIPPLRTQADRDGLRAGLANGTIAAICSDHQPHDLDAKLDAFPSTEPGVASLETLLPLALRLVEAGTLSLSEAIARLTSGPAGVLGLSAGTLSAGAPADVCIFDPDLCWRVQEGEWHSNGCNTPYWGETFRGRVTQVFLGGRPVYPR
jgi:dihydroorotase